MKPLPSKSRAVAFNVLWFIAVVGNLTVSVLDYIVWSHGLVGEGIYEQLVGSGWGHYAVAAAAAALAAIVVPAAYLASFDRRRAGRPVIRLYLLWFSLGVSLAGYVLGTAHVAPENYPVFVGAAVLVLLVPLVPNWLEGVLGRGKIRAADAMLRSGHPLAALPLVRMGLLFQPSDAAGERVYGLVLARRGRGARAMPYLQDVYARGDRSPDLLMALAGAEETEGDPRRAAELVEELQAVRPSTDNFERLIRLWTSTGQTDRVLKALQGLMPDERRAWAETLQDLLFQAGDRQGLRTLAAELEQEGAPFYRSRRCFERLLDLEGNDASTLSAAADLWERAGDKAGALNLLERLAGQQSPVSPDLLRRLAAHYEAQGRGAEAMRRRTELVGMGAATREEKQAVLNDFFSRGEYEKAIALVGGDSELRSDPQAASTLAFALFESGRADAALEQAESVRGMGVPSEMAAELASMEATIRSQRLSGELAQLAQRVEAEPEDLDLRFQYLDRLAASRAFDRVVVSLEELLTRHPELQPRVIEAVEQMRERYGTSGRLTSYLADLNLRQGDWDRAFALAEEVANASLHPGDVLRSWTRKILRGNPRHAPSLLAEARLALATGKAAEALSRLDEYLQAGGERTVGVMRLELDAAAAAGELGRADAAGLELLATEPENRDLLMRLAEIASERKDYETALERMRRVLEAEPERPGLQLLVRRTEERAREARIEALRRLLAEGPENPDVREQIGDLLHDLGRLNEAIVEYQKAAHAHPESHVARAKLGYVLVRKGLYSDAEEVLARTTLHPDQEPGMQARIKALFYSSAETMEDDYEEARALSLYKRIFNVDAGYRDVLPRIEHLQRVVEKKQKR